MFVQGFVAILAALVQTAIDDTSSTHAAGISQVVAYTGMPLPGGSGTFKRFAARNSSYSDVPSLFFFPSLNDHGQLAFAAQTSQMDGLPDGVFSGNALELRQLADRNRTLSYMDLSFYNANVSINNQGEVGFLARYDSSSAFEMLVESGGKLHTVAKTADGSIASGAMNQRGQLAFPFGKLVRGDKDSVVTLASAGMSISGGGSISYLTSPTQPPINDLGQSVFLADASGIPGVRHGLFLGDGTTIVSIALSNRPASGIPDFDKATLNDLGQVAYLAKSGATGGGYGGIFVGDGVSNKQLALHDQLTPSGTENYKSFLSPAINNKGQVAFTACALGCSDREASGLYRSGDIGIIELARAGQFVPGGDGKFQSILEQIALNEAGQVAFQVRVQGSVGNKGRMRLYRYDDQLGYTEIARTDTPLLGSTITHLAFAPSTGRNSNELSGFNNEGQLAYYFRLADGREGIAVWSVPEPSTAMLLVSSLFAIGCRRGARAAQR